MSAMLRRMLVAAFLSWGILVVPSLCRAGILEHLCECGLSSSCGHEESCTSDPCTLAKPTSESGSPQLLSSAPPIATLPCQACYSAPHLLAPSSLDPQHTPTSPALKPGARPLLI